MDEKTVPTSAAPMGRLGDGIARALTAARVAQENRGRDLVVLDVRKQTSVFDYFVICTGTSRRQLHAISEEIDDALEKGHGDRRLGIEGYEESRWILLDYGDIVIHIFDDETRAYYGLEDLWSEAERIPVPPLEPPAASGENEPPASDASLPPR